MKTITTTLFILLLSTVSTAQYDNWDSLITDGFGIPGQTTVPEMEVYNDTLYVTTAAHLPPGPAKMYRTGTGDFSDIENVTPPIVPTDFSIHSFGQTDSGGGYFYCGTGNPAIGCMIYSSTDGANWTEISYRGFGTPGLTAATPNMVVWQGSADTQPYLYAGAGSHGAGAPGQVWRIPYQSTNPNDWELLVDFDTVATVASDTLDMPSYFEVWGDTLYFGGNGKGQLWQTTDGSTFNQNMSVGYGWAHLTGDSTNTVLSSIEIYQDTMYITTTNFTGGQMWKSGDGYNWVNVTMDAFGEGNAVTELRCARVSFGELWVTGYTNELVSTGTPIWRTIGSGTSWVQSNANGFNNSDNNGQNAVIKAFGNYQYFGGPNYNDGSQVWRTQMLVGIEDAENASCNTQLFPNPIADIGYLTIPIDCPEIKKIQVFDASGRLIDSFAMNNESVFTMKSSGLKQGLYFYCLLGDSGLISTGKFVVK